MAGGGTVGNAIRSDREVLAALMGLAGSRATGQRPDPPWFHPFPARLPISVAEHLIGRITTSEAVVLDPMVGSGTTLIAARRLGRPAVGFDRDPLALLIARTATETFGSPQLERVRHRIIDRAGEIVSSGELLLPEVRSKMPSEDQAFIRYWFPPESQKQLFALAAAIEQEPGGSQRDLGWVVLSSLIIAKSAGASFALDISRSRPHKRTEKPVVPPFEAWNRRFKAAIVRLPFVDCEAASQSQIAPGDARSLPLERSVVDFVLTSPPYLNAVDYLRAHKFSLVWMGHTLGDLRELRGTMVGTERGLWSLDGLPPRLEKRLDQSIQENRRRAMLRRYLSDLRKVLAEIERVLRPGGLALLVVGPTIISSRRTDAVEVVTKLGKSVGLRFVGSTLRNLSAIRRSLPLPSPGRQDALSKRMRREVIVALRK